MNEELWGAVAGPHKYGVTLRIPGEADAASKLGMVSLRAPGTGFLETAQAGCTLQPEGADLLVHVPLQIAEQFEPDTPYLLEIPELKLTGSVENWPAPAAAGPTLEELMRQLNAPAPAPAPAPAKPEPVLPSAAPAPEPTIPTAASSIVPPDTPTKSNRQRNIVLAILGGLLLFFVLPLLLAWLFWGHLFHLSSPTVSTTPSPSMLHDLDGGFHPKGSAANPAGDLGALSVPQVLQQAPDVAALRQEGESRLIHGRADDGVLLLEAAAQRGDSSAMLDLAHLYDPARFKPDSPIPAPDMREAADYYQKAVKAGNSNAGPDRQALHDYLKKLSETGDNPSASLTLKDYWP